MLLIIKFLAKLLSQLNGEVSPRQLAAGFAFGALLGLIPAKGLLPLILLLLGFLININIPLMFVGAGIFKILSYLVDPLANQLGYFVLVKMAGLHQFWTTLYNTPVIPFTRFNNTITMGSLVLGLLLLIPVYFLAQWGIVRYRTSIRDRVQKLKLVQVLKSSTFYKWYLTYRGLTGD